MSRAVQDTLPTGYAAKRDGVEEYFDRTAADTWAQLTSEAPVSRIRATVRKGRDQMRAKILSWIAQDLHGLRVLDAGCGTGSMAIELVKRGANVTAIDLSPSLIAVAKRRYSAQVAQFGGVTFDQPNVTNTQPGVCWLAGDLLDPTLGRFDIIISMDCLIHYRLEHCVDVLQRLSERCNSQIIFTYAPSNPALALLFAIGKLFPRKDSSPRIEPIAQNRIENTIFSHPAMRQWQRGQTARVSSGFYTSQALELKNQ